MARCVRIRTTVKVAKTKVVVAFFFSLAFLCFRTSAPARQSASEKRFVLHEFPLKTQSTYTEWRATHIHLLMFEFHASAHVADRLCVCRGQVGGKFTEKKSNEKTCEFDVTCSR